MSYFCFSDYSANGHVGIHVFDETQRVSIPDVWTFRYIWVFRYHHFTYNHVEGYVEGYKNRALKFSKEIRLTLFYKPLQRDSDEDFLKKNK